MALLYTTTEGENIVANSIAWMPGDNVVIDDLHYEAAFVLYRQLEARHGIELRIARNRDGVVEAKDMEPLVDARTRLVSVAWVSSVNGYRVSPNHRWYSASYVPSLINWSSVWSIARR